MTAASTAALNGRFWLPMIVVRQIKKSARAERNERHANYRRHRAERNARIVAAFKEGRSFAQLAQRFDLNRNQISVIIRSAGLTLNDGGSHVSAVKAAQFEELERLIRKHRHFLPPGFRSASEVMARIRSTPLTTAG